MSVPRATLAAKARLQREVRKSRFVANAATAGDAASAFAFIATVVDRSATHNCWAYRIGQQYRFNDDGEPGGTAGRPILQAIEGQIRLVSREFESGNREGALILLRQVASELQTLREQKRNIIDQKAS